MAQIEVDNDVLVPTAKLLLQLVKNPDDVQFTHGPHGSVFVVPDAVAEEFVLAVSAKESKPEKKAK
jgi:hypothetical protein